MTKKLNIFSLKIHKGAEHKGAKYNKIIWKVLTQKIKILEVADPLNKIEEINKWLVLKLYTIARIKMLYIKPWR